MCPDNEKNKGILTCMYIDNYPEIFWKFVKCGKGEITFNAHLLDLHLSNSLPPSPPQKTCVLQTLKHYRSCLHGAEGVLEYMLVLVSKAVASVRLISVK